MELSVSKRAMWREGEDYWESVCLLLPDGHATLIDVDIFEWAIQFAWRVMGRTIYYPERIRVWYEKRRCGRTYGYYRHGGKTRMRSLPREIVWEKEIGMNRRRDKGWFAYVLSKRDVDHVNRNYWDNRGQNLRMATRLQNMMNRGKTSASKLKYKGIYQVKGGNKWTAKKTLKGKHYHIGTFNTELEAVQAYNKFIRERCGEFGYINPITIGYDEENHRVLAEV